MYMSLSLISLSLVLLSFASSSPPPSTGVYFCLWSNGQVGRMDGTPGKREGGREGGTMMGIDFSYVPIKN